MGIKKWSDFNKEESLNEGIKKFSDKKKSTPEKEVKSKRGHVSGSSEYADDVNQNIVKQKSPRKGTKATGKERNYKSGKVEQKTTNPEIVPHQGSIPPKKDDKFSKATANIEEEMEEVTEGKVEIFGKIAKFPEGIKASKAFNWMHNLKDPKLSKKDIWYLMVEKQDTELQMIKYQQKAGVNLTQFVTNLKEYYIKKYGSNPKIVESISKIELGGDEGGNLSAIRNIPNLVVDGDKKLIAKLTEDLIRLLG